MQITVHGQEKYIPVSTITIVPAALGVTYPFHCPTCGNTHAIFGGLVSKIYPILEPSSQIPKITTCKSCKTKYVFQDGEANDNEYIDVLLFPHIQSQTFYCYLGGGSDKNLNRILTYDTRAAFSYIENKPVELPYITACSNSGCEVKYQFKQFS